MASSSGHANGKFNSLQEECAFAWGTGVGLLYEEAELS